jgi:transposase
MPRRRLPRRRYTDEFKAEAVRILQQSDESLAKVARDLGITTHSLRAWHAAIRPPVAADRQLTEDERSELTRLRRENQRLRMERDILKKATAFFARHSE